MIGRGSWVTQKTKQERERKTGNARPEKREADIECGGRGRN